MTDPLRSHMEYDGKEERDKVPNESSIVEHRHQIRYEHANEKGQYCRYQFHSALQEEVLPFPVLRGVSVEYDDVDIVDHVWTTRGKAEQTSILGKRMMK